MAGQSVFLSYRRSDGAATVERLHDVLATFFGSESVFRDLDAIGLGTPFDVAVREAIRQCRVCLVVIGPGWLDARDMQGEPRLHHANDPVAVEVRTALQSEVAVIPVLVDGATMPSQRELPAPLADLALRNAFTLRAAAFHADLGRLLGQLGDHDPAALALRANPAGWEDLVLPPTSREQLQQVLLHLRHGPALRDWFGRWADDDHDAAPTVLLWGPSGCGKSLAGRVLSSHLELDLYRIELDDVLLRWQAGDRLPIDWLYRRIGASRVAVQVRDSGTAVGERSNTAAMLLKTLLRHLRRRGGLLIVTRPLVPHADHWLRFDHTVPIPFPDAELRLAIWRQLTPPGLPLADDVDLTPLAHLPLAGADIRRVIRQAAINAMGERRPVSQRDLLQAADAWQSERPASGS